MLLFVVSFIYIAYTCFINNLLESHALAFMLLLSDSQFVNNLIESHALACMLLLSDSQFVSNFVFNISLLHNYSNSL